ncbi:hypothetical protein B7494_g2996 [Chlorociboria aeruginascens]|nr:hypothetical protein B7494_g2996 [Chlorociboria aeruginascens]
MSVLEICQLELKSPFTASSPELLPALQSVRTLLGTSSQFYISIASPSTLYILGLWASLELHQAFLSSPDKAKLLGGQNTMLQFTSMAHVPLAAMRDLPLAAPVLLMERFEVKEGVGMREGMQRVWSMVEGWRVDAPEGKSEYLVFTGWESEDAHNKFAAKQAQNKTFMQLGEYVAGLESVACRNLEREG